MTRTETRRAALPLLGLALACCLLAASAASYQEDDLVFDDVGEETPTASSEQPATTSEPNRRDRGKPCPFVQRLLGMPDAVAQVGHVFKLHVPKQAFSGSIDYYEARGNNGKGLAHWLHWDEPAGALSGVPSRKDVGRHRVVIKAFGKHGDTVQDSFLVHVVPESNEHFKHKDGKKRCARDQERTLLTLLVDARYENLKPSAKVNALENLAGFLGLHSSWVSIQPEAGKDSSCSTAPDAGSSIVLSGPGNVARRREKHSTLVQWQVGCDGHFWQQHVDSVKLIPEQARDGTLSEVLQLPVYKWLVRSDSTDYARNRRDTAPGSGDGMLRPDDDDDDDDQEYDEDDEDYDENYDDNNEGITDSPQETKPRKPVIRPVDGASPGGLDEHPHRHHHGEDSIAGIHNLDNEDDFIWRNAEINNSLFNKTTTTPAPTYPEPPVEPKQISTSSSAPSWSDRVTESFPEEPIDAYDPYDISKHVPFFSSSSSTPTTTTTTTITPVPTTPTTTTTTTVEPSTTPPTRPTTTTTTEPPSTTSPKPSTTTTTTTTTTEAPTTRATTPERIDYGIRNNAPRIGRRLKRIPVTQGKVLSYEIPEDAFNDFEDGNTRNLRLQVYEKDGIPLKPSYWLQFNENTQEIYGLPDDKVYSSYFFDVVATDRGGLSVSDKLEIVVQQHKQQRAFNHDFHLYLKIDKRNNFRTNVDWQLKVMRSLAELYGDSDLSYITVRSVDIENDQAIYTWTNDSLARTDSCPHEEIDRLYSLLVSNKKTEEPSEALIRVLDPEIKVKRVVYQGLEQCQQSKETNERWPIVRNQIDHLKALVGSLYVHKVKKDTFFDEDDGDTSKLKLFLYTGNRSDVPPYDWLQFDSKNQEFYGVPLREDIGRKTYQLIARDKEGLEATDSLVAEVKSLPEEFQHNVEIKMTINMPYETFVHSAQHKRQFIQKLANVYGERNISAINILSVSGNRETSDIVWRNFSLPEEYCPNDQITRMRRALVTDDKNYTFELSREFKDEFSIIMISFTLTGECRNVVVAGADIPSKGDTTAKGARQEEYLITFVLPAVIIATMLVLAGIIAFILYKRRRSGKMSVSEKDDERQSFRSKGIPVIFQDELDEKPDPGNKSPIILKEEKPPLPPPEYQRAEDGADIPMLSKENSEEPYQPPPPFATNRDNNRQNRPKPTPTYRKPPPYVPP
ncbi:dystroglycan 1-like isoform X2 [Phymastichus coffea]|uniref:dystroglycan 1-like isoform X2 n=1 Tax=Phymastichus coffea TaxID=108790 RepID=UPI00273CD4AE|nr:dystroglycan 1-like isoform X2 [Phymastichus coffea]